MVCMLARTQIKKKHDFWTQTHNRKGPQPFFGERADEGFATLVFFQSNNALST